MPPLPAKTPVFLDKEGMIAWLNQTVASDWEGLLEYEDLKWISSHSPSGNWELKLVALEEVGDWLADPEPINRNPIVWVPFMNQVLDGKHRVGAANARDEEYIWAYVPA